MKNEHKKCIIFLKVKGKLTEIRNSDHAIVREAKRLTVYETARDEARHGRTPEGLSKLYFGRQGDVPCFGVSCSR